MELPKLKPIDINKQPKKKILPLIEKYMNEVCMHEKMRNNLKGFKKRGVNIMGTECSCQINAL